MIQDINYYQVMLRTRAFGVYFLLTLGDVATTLFGTLNHLAQEMNPMWAWSLPDHPFFFAIARTIVGVLLVGFFYSSKWLDRIFGIVRTRRERDLMLWIACAPLLLVVLSNLYQLKLALEK